MYGQKARTWRKLAGAKRPDHFEFIAARLKSCPDTKQNPKPKLDRSYPRLTKMKKLQVRAESPYMPSRTFIQADLMSAHCWDNFASSSGTARTTVPLRSSGLGSDPSHCAPEGQEAMITGISLSSALSPSVFKTLRTRLAAMPRFGHPGRYSNSRVIAFLLCLAKCQ